MHCMKYCTLRTNRTERSSMNSRRNMDSKLQISNAHSSFREEIPATYIYLYVRTYRSLNRWWQAYWNSASDHGATATALKPGNGRVRREITVSTRSVANTENVLRAAKHYEEHLLPVSMCFSETSSVRELEDTCKELEAVMLKPWLKLRGTRSSKYKLIRDGHLQRLSRQRDKPCWRALKLNDVDSWKEHKDWTGKLRYRYTGRRKLYEDKKH